MLQRIQLVADRQLVGESHLNRLADALSKQIMRDLGPIWHLQGHVSACFDTSDLLADAWPVFIRLDAPRTGNHSDSNGQPLAVVRLEPGWEFATSHEVIEMLVDPFGNKLIAGESLKDGQGRVLYLVEPCDPCQSLDFGYTVDGFLLSDFYTPAYFDPVTAPGVRYSFRGHITRPRQVLRDGYLTWRDPDGDEWWQKTCFDGQEKIFSIGDLSNRTGNLRSEVDRISHREGLLSGKTNHPLLAKTQEKQAKLRATMKARAERTLRFVEEQILGLKTAAADAQLPAEPKEPATKKSLSVRSKGKQKSTKSKPKNKRSK